MKRLVLVLGSVLCLSGAAQAQVNTGDVKWGPAPPVLPKGAQMAVLAGDPSKTGMFVVRLKFPAGYQVPAHHHPTSEYVTVIDGDFSLGMGDKLDKDKSASLKPGGFAVAPAGMNHFAWTKDGATVQINAEGPFQIVYVNPADDPSKH
jgi:quercetin dioxygenase-like cupin family protein